MLLLPVLQAVSELVRALRNLIPGARWRELAILGDRETRIWVAWHMGAERGPWDSASWVKGFLPPAECLVWGGGVSGAWNQVVWGLGLQYARKRKGCTWYEHDCVCDQLWGQQFSSCVDGGGSSVPHKQANKRLPPETAWGQTC